MWTSVWILYFVLKFATTLKDHITVLVFLDIVWWLIESTAKQQVNINSELLIFTSCTILSLVHTCETSTSNWKLCLYTWSKHKKMKHLRAQSGLCVVFFAYACFTNVHTGETNKISTSTRERENVSFSCACAYFTSVNLALGSMQVDFSMKKLVNETPRFLDYFQPYFSALHNIYVAVWIILVILWRDKLSYARVHIAVQKILNLHRPFSSKKALKNSFQIVHVLGIRPYLHLIFLYQGPIF